MKNKGFTLTELLIIIIVSMITLLAISSLFITSNRAVQVVKPASETIEEVQTGLATLDFVMSRWGVGFPCGNNCLYDATQNCPNFVNFNLRIDSNTTIDTITSAYGNNPICMSILNNGTGVQFYASLGGNGFVKSYNNNRSELVSCRLSGNSKDNCYFLFNPTFNGFVQLSRLNFLSNRDCIDLDITSSTNATVSNQLPVGGLLIRSPHFVTIYVQDGWLRMDKKDIGNCNDNENAINIARVRSFRAERVNSRSVRFTIDFVSQTDPNKVFRVERIYSR